MVSGEYLETNGSQVERRIEGTRRELDRGLVNGETGGFRRCVCCRHITQNELAVDGVSCCRLFNRRKFAVVIDSGRRLSKAQQKHQLVAANIDINLQQTETTTSTATATGGWQQNNGDAFSNNNNYNNKEIRQQQQQQSEQKCQQAINRKNNDNNHQHQGISSSRQQQSIATQTCGALIAHKFSSKHLWNNRKRKRSKRRLEEEASAVGSLLSSPKFNSTFEFNSLIANVNGATTERLFTSSGSGNSKEKKKNNTYSINNSYKIKSIEQKPTTKQDLSHLNEETLKLIECTNRFRWPHFHNSKLKQSFKGETTAKRLKWLLLVFLFTLSFQHNFQHLGKGCVRGEILVTRNSNRRVSRQISSVQQTSQWRNGNQLPVSLASGQQQQQQNVPYKTFYVTRACEWKSNLFVPKSNDIHFAQNTNPIANLANEQQLQQRQSQESSVAYETFGANNNNNNYATTATRNSGQFVASAQTDNVSGSRTMLSTDSKALILALPIVMSQSFAGYEPACSIRLIVPKNMRILAKLTSRRLTFAQQQQQQTSKFELDNNSESVDNLQQQQGLQQNYPQFQQQQTSSLWFNVSQNQFIETEQRIIETEGNVLAFRFLLDRFANKQVPDIRFQVVLTAFQTLSENSDLNGAAHSSSNRPSSSVDSNAQFICDQQRLISANLACDGFKNCQDGQDEELTTCLALKSSQTDLFGGGGNQQVANQAPNGDQVPVRDQTLFGGGGGETINFNQQLPSDSSSANKEDQETIWMRIWHYMRDTHSLAGFFLGFLLVLALLTCCSCCFYLAFLLYRNRHRNTGRNEMVAEEQEADHLASAQNNENLQLERSGARNLPAAGQQQQQQQQEENKLHTSRPQPPARLQSILKRPLEPPPAVPDRPQQRLVGGEPAGKRGALSSSMSRGQVRGGPQFKPTPAKRITRPTRPVPLAQPEDELWRPTSQTVGGFNMNPPNAKLTTKLPSGIINYNPPTTTGSITTSVTGTQRITTYHYSSGTTRLSESYLQRLAVEQRQQQQERERQSGATAAPPGDPNVNYRREPSSVSPQSSLI